MKHLLSYILISSTIVVSTTSCSDFLDTAPYDALSPATTWNSETDARSFAVGCYNKWLDGYTILYQDCASAGKNGQYTEMESSVLPILVPVSTISQQFVVVMISWKT